MKLSIIVPVYNVEQYIEECLESLFKIDIKNYEILVVDDGSKDSSIDKVKKLNNEKVKILVKENGGLSSARNFGLKYATGEYILFIDSDDYIINQHVIKNMVNLADNNNLDVVIGNGYKYFSEENKSKLYSDNNKPAEKKYSNEEYILEALKSNYYQEAVWLNLYKKNLIKDNNIQFLEGYMHEDIEWTPRVLLKAKSIGVINECFYIYRQREGSIMTNRKSTKNCEDIMKICKKLYKEFDDISNSEVKNQLQKLVTELYFRAAMRGRKNNSNFLKEADNKFLVGKGSNFKHNIKYKMYSLSPEVFFKAFELKFSLKKKDI